MISNKRTSRRVFLLVGLLVLVFLSHWRFAELPGQGPRSDDWLAVAEDAQSFGKSLIERHPARLYPRSRQGVVKALRKFRDASGIRFRTVSARTSLTQSQINDMLAKVDGVFSEAGRDMGAALKAVPGLIDLGGQIPLKIERRLMFPFGSGVVILHRKTTSAKAPAFIWRTVDVQSKDRTVDLDPAVADDFFLAVELRNAPVGSQDLELSLSSGSSLVATVHLSVVRPPASRVEVQVRDGGGKPTEAAIGLYSPEGQFLVPEAALEFSKSGYRYQATQYRDHKNAAFWPGGEGFTRCFFVKGDFAIDLPTGSYRLIAAKGPEYTPLDQTFSVADSAGAVQELKLRRWVDMSANGWHSGDCHLHYARANVEANRSLLLWTQAEDLRMGNILRMGDGRRTYFEQYAFGKEGRFIHDRGAFVPGQEDPRTSVLGHTISLNLKKPIRYPQTGYYLYSKVFDEARSQGGLSGYAHVNSNSFLVDRDLSINVPRGKVDFAEICEFGEVNTDLYYEFLNLGFRLTAVGGSDAPWGDTAGDSRVYVYSGKDFDPDDWFQAVRDGRTFVTTAPMLDFTVNGERPGKELDYPAAKTLRVYAKATLGFSRDPLGPLEIVANGDVIRTAQPKGNSAVLDFELPADKSMWIAARVKGAHTTPVYVKVAGARHWNESAAPGLLKKRLRLLNDVERLIDKNGERVGLGQEPVWESPEAFQSGREELRSMIGEARRVYRELQNELQ